jgi:hypothetical protein
MGENKHTILSSAEVARSPLDDVHTHCFLRWFGDEVKIGEGLLHKRREWCSMTTELHLFLHLESGGCVERSEEHKSERWQPRQ